MKKYILYIFMACILLVGCSSGPKIITEDKSFDIFEGEYNISVESVSLEDDILNVSVKYENNSQENEYFGNVADVKAVQNGNDLLIDAGKSSDEAQLSRKIKPGTYTTISYAFKLDNKKDNVIIELYGYYIGGGYTGSMDRIKDGREVKYVEVKIK